MAEPTLGSRESMALVSLVARSGLGVAGPDSSSSSDVETTEDLALGEERAEEAGLADLVVLRVAAAPPRRLGGIFSSLLAWFCGWEDDKVGDESCHRYKKDLGDSPLDEGSFNGTSAWLGECLVIILDHTV